MSERPEDFDLIVVGLGAMGAAVLHHAARQGLSVLGIDRFDPPHAHGSSHAETRITRLAVAEGPQYLPFVARSHELWRELEEVSGERLLHRSGGYIVTERDGRGDRWNDFVVATDRIARAAGVEYSLMEPAIVREQHPMLRLPDDVRVGFEPTAGVLMAERAVAAQLDSARRHGASVSVNRRVRALEPKPGGVEVAVEGRCFRAGHVVVSTGAWLPELASARHAGDLTVTRQVVHWFDADDLERFSVERFPFVMWVGETDEDYVCVFPVPPGATPGVKIMGEQFLDSTSAAEVDRSVSPAEVDEFFETHVRPKVDGVNPRCLRSEVCLYTNTPDDHFLIEPDPRSESITVMSPCSGHGFKHSAALGEAVAETVASGSSTLDLSPFRRGGRHRSR